MHGVYSASSRTVAAFARRRDARRTTYAHRAPDAHDAHDAMGFKTSHRRDGANVRRRERAEDRDARAPGAGGATVDDGGAGKPTTGREGRRSANETAGVYAVLVFIALRFAQRYFKFSKKRFITTEWDAPLTTTRDAYLSPWKFEALKQCALTHPKLRVKGGLNDNGFSKTRGFVVKFNTEGVDEFKAKEEYACFRDVFDDIRLPDANAFVMNILLCELGDYDQYNADELSVGLHLDTTVGIYSRHMFVAHQVSVLYASVPNDMRGGALEVFPYGDGDPRLGATPDEVIAPKENTLVTFRGDAFHQVKSYSTRTGRERVSLVLEQYKIDDEMYPKTLRFHEAFKSNMTMM